MPPSKRQLDILKHVRFSGFCTTAALAETLQVSMETIRRNVNSLAAEGLLEKIHGGVSLPESLPEPSFTRRLTEGKESKQKIAALVSAHIRNGESLFLDNSSTTAYVAMALSDHRNLFIVTNSASIANILVSRNGNRVFLAGGELREHDAGAFGPEALEFVSQFELQHAILSASAAHCEKGFMVNHLCEAVFSQALIEHSQQAIMVLDHSKFEKMAPVKQCDFSQIQQFVSDKTPPKPLLEAIKLAGCDISIAEEQDRFTATR
ncbi:DeoR/GlpR family DNA-binding transcription regulator [Kiloniella laminariae]|uniref:DeoR/GlpR family DNA-binding transcription regulator n=1 Tax=Kiloniella laminariae TaxID=454162 RepID=UPI0003677A10|nr:DeoR/GlpR family DNA-binding transcription regulator [Kiloniella laminariae]